MVDLRAVFEAGMGCLAPDTCCACDHAAGAEPGWCDPCRESLPWIPASRCGFCGGGGRDGGCRCGPEPWTSARVLLDYSGPLPALIGRWKFAHDAATSRAIDALLEAAGLAFPGGALVTCVPQSFAAWGRRGFSPALELARRIARCTGAPLRHPLGRARRAPPQVGLTARQRDRNVRRLFRVPARRRRLVHDRSVVLVDDVLTTGSTARACCRALRAAGAARVDLVALARARPR